MAEVAVDERRLLKTIRWWDGFVIGLANPGFLLDRPLGLDHCARRSGGHHPLGRLGHHRRASGLHLLRARRHVPGQAGRPFRVRAGGMAQALLLRRADRGLRYWFAWSSVLAIYGSLIGYLLIAEFGGDGLFRHDDLGSAPGIVPLGWAQLIGVMCIVLCWAFNVRGMRPAVGLELRRRRPHDHPHPRDRRSAGSSRATSRITRSTRTSSPRTSSSTETHRRSSTSS